MTTTGAPASIPDSHLPASGGLPPIPDHMHVETLAIHAAHGADAATGAVAPPIYLSTTFEREADGSLPHGYLYARDATPNRTSLERVLAALEGGQAAAAFSAGMAATMAVFQSLAPGDHVILPTSVYYGTRKLLDQVFARWGLTMSSVDMQDADNVVGALRPTTRLVWVESPSNPLLAVADIERIATIAHDAGARCAVDNTWATPVAQQPLALGADLVMHSLTKALAGHSDLLGGALVGSHARVDAARATLKILGGCLDPHAAFLALRGLRTLHLRVERQCRNALALARHFEGHAALRRVHYPGLESHPGHATARRQMAAFGGMITFELRGGLAAAERFFDRLELVARAASLGGVESLASLPVHTSHHGLPEAALRAAGIDPGMVRLSIGVEDEADLVADLEHALAG